MQAKCVDSELTDLGPQCLPLTSADPEGGGAGAGAGAGVPDTPWKITRYMGFYRE